MTTSEIDKLVERREKNRVASAKYRAKPEAKATTAKYREVNAEKIRKGASVA